MSEDSGSDEDSDTKSDSDSDSEDAEEDEKADNSIMLNIGEKVSEDEDDYDPESRHMLNENGLVDGGAPLFDGGVRLFDGGGPPLLNDAASPDDRSARSKEEAFAHFSQKYPTPPVILNDLDRKDFERQVKYIHYTRELHEIDRGWPITCPECLQKGHLERVCPTKEVHLTQNP